MREQNNRDFKAEQAHLLDVESYKVGTTTRVKNIVGELGCIGQSTPLKGTEIYSSRRRIYGHYNNEYVCNYEFEFTKPLSEFEKKMIEHKRINPDWEVEIKNIFNAMGSID